MNVLLACLAGSMEALASFAAKELGGLDLWVNNAGASQAPKAALADSEPSVLQAIVDTNLTCAQAIVHRPSQCEALRVSQRARSCSAI